MKKILIVGELFSENLGDGVICDVVKKYFETDYIVDFLDLSGRKKINYYNNKNDYSFNIWKEEIKYYKSNIKKMLYKIGIRPKGKNINNIYEQFKCNFDQYIRLNNPDLILFAGGQMFIDTFIMQINYVCEYAKKNNIKIIFNACGVGKLLMDNILENIIKNESVKYISLRDGADNFEKKYKYKPIDTYDTVVIANRFYSCQNNNKYDLGVGIMLSQLQSVKKQKKFWIKMLKKLKENKIEFKVFTNGSYKDQSFAKYVLMHAGYEYKNILLKKPNTPEELIELINSFKSIISMRLHSLIIAYSFNIPTIAISWDKKVEHFFNKIKRQEMCYKIYDNKIYDVKKLISLLNKNYDYNAKKEIQNNIDNNLSKIKDIIDR